MMADAWILLIAPDFLSTPATQSEPTLRGWDAATWTAIGTVGATIVALGVAVIGAFWNSIKSWLRKPRLVPLADRVFVHSELVSIDGEAFWQLRLPIKNKAWRRAATNVEVFLSDIKETTGSELFSQPTYLPIRLQWSHARGLVCERIASGVYRLLDLGKVRPGTEPVSVTFDTEIPRVNQDLVLPDGCYILRIIVAADGVTKRYRLRLRLKEKILGPNLADCVDLERLRLINLKSW